MQNTDSILKTFVNEAIQNSIKQVALEKGKQNVKRYL